MNTTIRRKVCYISGPISSDPDYRSKFYAAEEKYIQKGFDVINPVRIDDETACDKTNWTWKDYIVRDLKIVLSAELDTVVMLPSWGKDSRGALAGFYLAVMVLGLDVYYEKGE